MDLTNSSNVSSSRILVLGLGGAGCNTLARIAPRAPEGMNFAVLDCDVQTLEACTIETRILVGKALTDGLSTGGDPEVGRRCGENSVVQIETLLSGVHLLIVVAGLGGGLGAGVAPVVIRIARSMGATTLVFAVMPFPFEGTLVLGKAQNTLRRLRTYADAIVQMPNAMIQPDGDALFEDSLESSSRTLAAGVIGLWRMLAYKGMYNLDFASLQTLLSHCDAFCRFACSTATGEGRADTLIHALRQHPLVKGSSVFDRAPGMIIGITGGDDLKLAEIQQIVEAMTPRTEDVWMKIGVSIDPTFAGRIAVIMLAAEAWKEPLIDDQRGGLKPLNESGQQGELAGFIKRSRTFDGAERTIWNGEDLDLPTYIRRKIKLPR